MFYNLYFSFFKYFILLYLRSAVIILFLFALCLGWINGFEFERTHAHRRTGAQAHPVRQLKLKFLENLYYICRCIFEFIILRCIIFINISGSVEECVRLKKAYNMRYIWFKNCRRISNEIQSMVCACEIFQYQYDLFKTMSSWHGYIPYFLFSPWTKNFSFCFFWSQQ